MKKKLIIIMLGVLGCFAFPMRAEQTVLPPLFEYPVAPEDISDWGERSAWLVEHFWDGFDFKAKTVGQAQLNHAFKTWVIPMRFAPAKVVMGSVENLLKRLKKNPGLLLQFAMAAERNIYDPATSEVTIDDVYEQFLRAVAECKKLPQVRRVRYASQLERLTCVKPGAEMPEFDYSAPSGEQRHFEAPRGSVTLIEFGDPDCPDCLMLKLHLLTDQTLLEAQQKGDLQIAFIVPDAGEEERQGLADLMADFPQTWSVGIATGLDDELDLRFTPSLYLLDREGRLVSKNACLEEVKALLAE